MCGLRMEDSSLDEPHVRDRSTVQKATSFSKIDSAIDDLEETKCGRRRIIRVLKAGSRRAEGSAEEILRHKNY